MGSENYLATDIIATETALAALLDELHPSAIVFSARVQLLVRLLLLLEDSMTVYKEQLEKFQFAKLAFTGIGGGALPATRALF